jgi:hypothetical protein
MKGSFSGLRRACEQSQSQEAIEAPQDSQALCTALGSQLFRVMANIFIVRATLEKRGQL